MPNASPFSDSLLPGLCEAGLVLLLAVQVGLLGWKLLEPQGPVGAPSLPYPFQARPLPDGFDPFDGAIPAGDAQVSRGGDWKLFGTRIGSDGGSAILGAGAGRQAAYRAGDRVAPGLVLERVAVDHVLLRGSAGVQRLDPVDIAGAGASRAAIAPAAAAGNAGSPAIDAAPAQPLAEAGLQARRQGGQVTGYTLMAQADERLMRQAGLQPGDVLLSLDGLAIDPQSLQTLIRGQDGAPKQATLTFERDGQVHRVVLENPQS